MFKYLTNITLSVALIFPPWPLPPKPLALNPVSIKSLLTIPQVNGYHFSSNPGIKTFSDTLNGLNVSTIIKKTDQEIIQEVFLKGMQEESFKFILEPNASFKTDEFVFSQKVENNYVVTKEWIVTKDQNVPGGSRYQWRFVADSNIGLEKTATGEVNIVRRIKENQVMLARIEPFVYWTDQGLKKNAAVNVEQLSSGAYLITLTLQEPKSAYPLMIDPSISYGQWLGDGSARITTVAAVAIETGSGEIYVGGATNGVMLNVGTIVGTLTGTTEGFVAEVVSANPPVVNWMHFLGGTGSTYISSLAINSEEIYAGGYSDRQTEWETAGASFGVITNTNYEGVIVEIADGSPPSLSWRMFVGGVSDDYVYAIAVNGDEIYAGGSSRSQSAAFDAAGSTVGTKTSTDTEGFVLEIADGSPPTLEWLMWLGGSNTDIVYALTVNSDEIYAGGYSISSDSWDTAGSSVGTYTNPAVNEGFVVEIADGGPPTLNWHMWLGGVGHDEVFALAVNGDEVYAGGYSNSSDSIETAGSYAGTMTNSESPGEGFVVEIGDGGPPTLDWHMWLGGFHEDRVYAIAVNGDEIYAIGDSRSSQHWDTIAVTVGTFPGSNNQGFIVEIADGSPPTFEWRMWLGSDDVNLVYGLALNGESIYVGGYSSAGNNMETFTTVSGSLLAGGNSSAFIAELTDGNPPTYFWLQWFTGSGSSQVNALAVNGNEIYAGGQSYGQTLGTVPDVGTPNYTQEGFVVEIADGGTPSLNWRVWIGGNGASAVNALAINGNEIYAGGTNTGSSNSWETYSFTAGTVTNGANEAFVVAIGDGATPDMVWRMWLGGTSGDYVTGLAVNGDEVYAAGYSGSSVQWDTASYTAGTYTNTGHEGFVVEITEGGPPTLEWIAWVGGNGADYVYALAINGDEIYVGGSTPSSGSAETVGSTIGTFTETGEWEGYIYEISDGSPPTYEWHFWLGGEQDDELYALAVVGDEIYAGGRTSDSDSWEVPLTIVGTLTNTGVAYEGYVLEIADGGPPTLQWLMWLGGFGADEIVSLAINGDEIYAAGYSASTASWDTAISVIGTWTNTAQEGFIVEIADGSTPTLNWRVWSGGVGADQVFALAVSGNEVYAGGYAPSTLDMEGAFSGTKYDGQNSGYIIEISDDATATINALFLYMD